MPNEWTDPIWRGMYAEWRNSRGEIWGSRILTDFKLYGCQWFVVTTPRGEPLTIMARDLLNMRHIDDPK